MVTKLTLEALWYGMVMTWIFEKYEDQNIQEYKQHAFVIFRTRTHFFHQQNMLKTYNIDNGRIKQKLQNKNPTFSNSSESQFKNVLSLGTLETIWNLFTTWVWDKIQPSGNIN